DITHITSTLLLSHNISLYPPTPTTQLYTLSLHDALPISTLGDAFQHRQHAQQRERLRPLRLSRRAVLPAPVRTARRDRRRGRRRSEEHTSELQSHLNLVCRLLLEKKKNKIYNTLQEDKT